MTLVHWAVSHASLSWTHSSAKTKYDLFLNEITLSGWADVACRNTVHELPVGLTSLCIRIRSRAELLSQQFIHDGHGGVHHSEGYFPCGRAVEIVMTPSLLKPGSTARSFLKLAR